MGIGDAIVLVGCLAGLVAALPALFIFLNLIFGKTTRGAAQRLQRGTLVPFFAGLVPAVILVAIATALISLGSIFQLIGFIMYLWLLTWGFTGLAAISRMIGAKLSGLTERDENPLLEQVVGAVVLTLAIAFPLVGWFVVLPLGLIVGTGATLLARFRRGEQREVVHAPVEQFTFDDTVAHQS
ncbi:MAG: hypothetical protein D6737_10755 [Chloroflexi bacterium]|nr:MAG: hypothetical protein CUN54_00335 [Phototrophicales bacterium]RMF79712.1 MAG: hypothetical protein D6737_10755 [Chloroflexota bacterium]